MQCSFVKLTTGHLFVPALVAALGFLGGSLFADGETRFVEVGDSVGITYRSSPTGRIAEREAIIAALPTPTGDFLSEVRPNYGMNAFGQPGVALLDYDGDGDLDIYATNGPGAANSLYSNQLRESGVLSFHDVAVAAGVDATDQDSSGVCFGDIDNDGDPDLYVLGLGEANRLFLNQGDGTFADVTAQSGVAGGNRHPTSCSFGDVDNDGLLDLAVGNTFDDWSHRLATTSVETYPGLEHNQLFLNGGGGVFSDVSAASGIEDVSNMSGPGLSGAAHSWVVTLVDYDGDGDVDLVSADNQGASPTGPEYRRGWNRLFENDGSGHFTDVTQAVGLDVDGSWMGLAFGDYDCNGSLDLFSTNVGDYEGPGRHSTLFLADAGSFSVAGPPEANVFGWGASSLDYDNDGDLDVVYHGGLDLLNLLFLSNPGVLYTNQGDCSGTLLYDGDAVETDHRLRTVHGVATGDLDEDGFPDIVSVASFDIVPNDFVLPFTLLTGPLDSPFDDLAFALNVLPGSIMPGFIVEGDPDLQLPGGSLAVELNSGDNGNRWVRLRTRGSAGTLPQGAVNRDGIGAVVSFTPDGGKTSLRPVLGGSSYASQDSLELGFGLGEAASGVAEIRWPGGTVNRAAVAAGESLLFPEIPCDYATRFDDFGRYVSCVARNLGRLARARVISPRDALRFIRGALSCEGNVQRICAGAYNSTLKALEEF